MIVFDIAIYLSYIYIYICYNLGINHIANKNHTYIVNGYNINTHKANYLKVLKSHNYVAITSFIIYSIC